MIVLLNFFIPGSAAAGETICIANGEWPPYQSKALKHDGVASHIVTEAFAYSGINVVYHFLPWKRGFEEVKKGNCHGAFLWTKSEKRERDFLFSDTFIQGKSVLFHLKSLPLAWNSVEDLKQYRLGGVIGYRYGVEIDTADRNGDIKIHRAIEDKQLFSMLLLKRIDAFPMTLSAGYVLLNKEFTNEQIDMITHHPKPTKMDYYRLMFSKKMEENQRYLSLFNRGLEKLRQSGRYDRYIALSLGGYYEQQ